MFGSMYTGSQVISAMEARAKGLRTRKAYGEVVKPDYSPLLTLGFYASYLTAQPASTSDAKSKVAKVA